MAPFPAALEFSRRILSLAENTPHIQFTPTRSTSDATRVVPRQATVTVVANDGNATSSNSLSGGAIAGIVIGSIAGFLLLLWIIRSCSNLGAPPAEPAWYDDVDAKRHRHGHRHHHRHHSPYRRSSTELRTVRPIVVSDRTSRSPRRPSPAYDADYRSSSRRRSRHGGY